MGATTLCWTARLWRRQHTICPLQEQLASETPLLVLALDRDGTRLLHPAQNGAPYANVYLANQQMRCGPHQGGAGGVHRFFWGER